MADSKQKRQGNQDLQTDQKAGDSQQAKPMLHAGYKDIKKPTIGDPRALAMLREYGEAGHSMVGEDPISSANVPPDVRVHNRGPRSNGIIRRDQESQRGCGPLRDGRHGGTHVLTPRSILAADRNLNDSPRLEKNNIPRRPSIPRADDLFGLVNKAHGFPVTRM